jgi:hypothetical protein
MPDGAAGTSRSGAAAAAAVSLRVTFGMADAPPKRSGARF